MFQQLTAPNQLRKNISFNMDQASSRKYESDEDQTSFQFQPYGVLKETTEVNKEQFDVTKLDESEGKSQIKRKYTDDSEADDGQK